MFSVRGRRVDLEERDESFSSFKGEKERGLGFGWVGCISIPPLIAYTIPHRTNDSARPAAYLCCNPEYHHPIRLSFVCS